MTNQWYTLYRSTSQNFNPDSSHIEDIILPSEEYSYEKTYDGLQNYQGSDYFTLTVSDRFHNESPLSNIVSTDSLISHPCTIISNITNNDTIDINTTFIFTFDKSINMEDFESKFTISPVLDNIYYKWENPSWKNGRKQISISFPGNLAFSTNYTVTIPGNITDDSGMLIDGNNDGSEGGDFSLTFKTEDVDLSGPLLLSVNIPNPLRPNDAISLIFNENVSLDDTFDNFTLNSAGSSASFYSSVYGNMVTLKAKSQLQTNTAYTLNIIGITDTLLNPMLNDTSFTLNSSDSYLTEIKSITDFSSESGWWDPNGSGSTVGVEDESDFIYSNKNYFPGNDYVSGALNYTWTNNSTEGYLLREHCVTPVADISFDTSYTLQAYIFGDNSNNSFRFSLYENGPSIAEVSVWTPINWTGWKLVEWDLSDPSMLGEWLGDGLMNGTTYYLEGIHIKRENFDLISSTIYIDQIQLIKSSVGIIPPNFPPIMETLSDTTMVEEGSIKIYVNFEDENLTDAHIILAESDTTGVNFSIYGNTSGARVYVKPVDGFHGTTNIRIIVKDLGVGELADTSEFILTVTPLSSIDNKLPREFALMQNYPNPFNPVSNISFNLAETNQSRLDIFDIRGRLVKTLVNRQLQAGNYNFTIDMSNESSGIYFYRLQSGEFMD
ncbi:MAG: Ig-like domain-containing protein, partial [Candidatus Marinimicrobia bacterium]|nr:Ig-like domain-containing protein [Candidatus Neomarinimicrobiota bacterium]